MSRSSRFAFAASAIALALFAAGITSAQAAALDRSTARIAKAERGHPLATAAQGAPADAVTGYLRTHGRSGAVVGSLRISRSSPGANGVSHLRMEQEVEGLKVYGSYVKAAVNKRGELTHVIEHLADVTPVAPNRVDAMQALRTTMARLHPSEAAGFTQAGVQGNTTTFNGGAFFHEQPTVTAVAIPMDNGTLERGWLVETWTRKTNQLHHTLIGADGAVLKVENRTASDSYNVYPVSPLVGPQTVVSGPAPGGTYSPLGWLGTNPQLTVGINGNNVNAYLDTNNNDHADRGGTVVKTGSFVASANLAASPSTTGNQAVAVQNLFYLTNTIHDILYSHGFTEAAGNFQSDNLGRGGFGGDPVQAEAQDGGGTDNANFATPPDGKKPRMQMYLWTGAGQTHEVKVNSPSARSYTAVPAEFGSPLSVAGITGNVVVASPSNGCTSISQRLAGKVVLIDRGSCPFITKAANAQAAGAAALVVANSVPGAGALIMGGTNSKVKIPSVMISYEDGVNLKSLSAPNATVHKLAVQPIQLDGSLDSGIVFHEFGHGLSWRMIGGMSGPLAGAIGEGNSDGIAMLVNGDDIMGAYASSSSLGIRRNRYEGYPRTYANVDGGEVHNDGEIYAATIWKMITLFGSERRGDLFNYVVDGMNYTPSTPTYEQMRDGILASVNNGPTPSDCTMVWQAFAQFGIGVGAQGVVNPDGSVSITPSFTAPDTCGN